MARTKLTPHVKFGVRPVTQQKLIAKANQAKMLTAEQQKKRDRKSHKGDKLNQWDPAKMKKAVQRYFDQKLPSWPKDKPVLSIR